MPSFNVINYSIRPSKSIQRQIVFDGLLGLKSALNLHEAIYIGLGSIWFTDFVLAHTKIDINRMISIEEDPVGYKRAKFNKPYSTVSVRRGHSNEIIPKLLKNSGLRAKPWVVWLDFDCELKSSVVSDVQTLVENAPINSVLIFTLNARPTKYGKKPNGRLTHLQDVLGPVVPDDLSADQCRDESSMQMILADLSLQFMKSVVAEVARPESFVPAFTLPYTDGAPMVTFGGIILGEEKADQVQEIVNGGNWDGMTDEQIVAPHLTVKEAIQMQSLLPTDSAITRDQIQELGFDLTDSEIAVFQKYYKHYPSFAQVVL